MQSSIKNMQQSNWLRIICNSLKSMRILLSICNTPRSICRSLTCTCNRFASICNSLTNMSNSLSSICNRTVNICKFKSKLTKICIKYSNCSFERDSACNGYLTLYNDSKRTVILISRRISCIICHYRLPNRSS